VLLGAAVLALVFLVVPGSVPIRTVSGFLLRPIFDHPVRVTGMLVKGSLCKVTRGPGVCEYRLRMADGYSSHPAPSPPPELRVRHPSCLIPDILRDIPGYDVSLTVEGEQCPTCSDFESSHISALCHSPFYYSERADGGSPEPQSSEPPPCAK
jgi:cytochrome c-type biogenesis protein CcmE